MGLSRALACSFSGIALLLAEACIGPGAAQAAATDFYDVDAAALAGSPGSIVRQEKLAIAVPDGGTAYRIVYRTTGFRGEATAASAVLVVPSGAAPEGGRPVVAWQHPTSGVAEACAPSLSPDVLKMIMGLPDLLVHGYVVVATDYPGLATNGPHPYLVGLSEGHAVLDAVRAVRNLPEAHAGDRFALWGHSQGGHATLFAGVLAASYAPELHLAGVAAAAPATALDASSAPMASSADGRLFLALILESWSKVFDAPLDTMIAAGDLPAVQLLGRQCFDPPLDSETQPPGTAMPNVAYAPIGDISKLEPWKTIAMSNVPGPLPTDVPALLLQGLADTTVPPVTTEAYWKRLCAAGDRALLVEFPGVVHRMIAHEAASVAVDWIADRFAGKPAPSDC